MKLFKSWSLKLLLIGCSLATGVSALNSCSSSNNHNQEYIFDCDTGLDDARALYIMLTNDINIVGIVCTGGNTTIENSIANTIWTLKKLNRLDIPIYQGFNNENGHSDNYFGSYGFGTIDVANEVNKDDYKNVYYTEKELTSFIKKNKGCNYLSTGPKTTIAKYIKYFDNVYSMGGSQYVQGNVQDPDTNQWYEFNQYFDLDAYELLMNSNIVKYNVYLDQCLAIAKDRAIDWFNNPIMTELINNNPDPTNVFFADELVALAII